MNHRNPWELVVAVYDYVHTALWALLAAFVIFFLVVVLPNMPKTIAAAQATKQLEIAAENENYCAKFGMATGTQKHDQCLLDLNEFRFNVEKRTADETAPF